LDAGPGCEGCSWREGDEYKVKVAVVTSWFQSGASIDSASAAGTLTVIVFVRPGQTRSASALHAAFLLRKELETPPWNILAAVSGDYTEEAVRALVRSPDFSGITLLDPKMSVYGAYGVIVTPSTVVIGRDGKVLFSKAGYDFEYDSVLNAYVRFGLGLIDARKRDALVAEGRKALAPHGKAARLTGLARRLRRSGKLDRAERGVWSFRPWRFLFAAAVASAVGFGATVFSFFYTSRPDFCSTCHNIRPYYESWKRSTHKEIGCPACHFNPGAFNYVKRKLLAVSEVVQSVTNTYEPRPRSRIPGECCLRERCHHPNRVGKVPKGVRPREASCAAACHKPKSYDRTKNGAPP